MSKELGLLTKVVGMDEATLTEKLSTPEGEKEISDKIAGMKVFKTNDEYLAHMNNHKDMLKDTLYNDHKATVLEMTEKNILAKSGLAWKRGEQFKNIEELVEKIAEEKVKLAKASGGGGTGDTKALDELNAKMEKLIADHTAEKNTLISSHQGMLMGKELDIALSGIKPLLDVETERLDGVTDFIKFNFNRDFTLREKDGKYEVFKGDAVYRDAEHKIVPLDVVLSNIATQVAKVKSSPASGRGNNNTGGDASSTDFSGFKDWNDFVNSQPELRKLTTGDPKLNSYYEAFMKSKGK